MKSLGKLYGRLAGFFLKEVLVTLESKLGGSILLGIHRLLIIKLQAVTKDNKPIISRIMFAIQQNASPLENMGGPANETGLKGTAVNR